MKKSKKTDKTEVTMPLEKRNYILLAIGFAIILLGFILMVGGDAPTPDSFNDNIFSWRRITLAPIVVVAGFVFEIYAIMKR